MVNDIGQITNKDGNLLCKMWLVTINPMTRKNIPHRHRNFEAAYVLDGKGTYHTDNRDYPIEKNSVFIFRSNETHCITQISQTLKILTLQFSPQHTKGLFEGFNNLFEKDTEIKNILLDIQKEFENKNEYYDEMVMLKIKELILTVTRYRKGKRLPDNIAETIEYIDNNFKTDINMQTLAKRVAISPNYLSKIFKNACGMSVWDYIESVRIDSAKKLLSADKTNIIDIAFESGYNNTANFNKQFKKYTGMTPRQFRKSAVGKINIDI